jgi:3-oxoadipate enol-lactonase
MPEETLTTSDGCRISYTLHPASRSGLSHLVLIHSLALDRTIWDDVVLRLAGEVEILAYDCRGHGQSGKGAADFTPELFACDLAELLDHIGWQSAAVGGCSMGGCVAQAFGGLYPQRASALGLIDTTAWYGADAPERWRERATAAREKGLGSLSEFQLTRWVSDAFRGAHPEEMDALTRVFLANDLDCYAATCTMLGAMDLRHHLGNLRAPTAVIVGEEDYATPVAASRQLHESIASSTLTIIPKARHLTPVECSEQVASVLLALVRPS